MAKYRLRSETDSWGGVVVVDLGRIGNNVTPGDSAYITELYERIKTLDKTVILRSETSDFEAEVNTVVRNLEEEYITLIHYYTDDVSEYFYKHVHLLYKSGIHRVVIHEYKFLEHSIKEHL